MATLIAEITTVDQVYPVGTVEELFHYQLFRSDGSLASELSVDNVGVSFPAVVPGDYRVVVTKNGVTVEASITVPKTEEVFDVPATITLRLE